MNPFFKRLMGIVHVEEKQGKIDMYSVDGRRFANDLARTWSTRKIEQHMFETIKPGRLKFSSFFAPDVHYMLQQLAKERYAQTSRGALRAAITALEEMTWLRRLKDEEVPSRLDRGKLKLFHKTPLEHQEKFFEVYDRATQVYGLNGYLLSAKAGSGKTISALMLAEMYKADHIVIVAPKNSIERVWAKTFREEYKKPETYWKIADGAPYSGQRMIISHYETLDKVLGITSKLNGRVVVILDECHNLNDLAAQRTRLFVDLCKRVDSEHVIWMSGTPIKALGQEAIPLLKTIDPLFTTDVENRFRQIFGKQAQRALDILRHRMGFVQYRVETLNELENESSSKKIQVKIPNGNEYTLDSIREEMREFIEKRLQYYASNEKKYLQDYENALDYFESLLETSEEKQELKRYRDTAADIRKNYDPQTHQAESKFCNEYENKTIIPRLADKQMRDEFKAARSVYKYVHLKVMGEALGGVLGRKRAEVHLAMIPHMKLEEHINDARKKTLIFTSYVAVAKAIGEFLRQKGFSPILVHGETNSQLTSMIEQFDKKPDVNPAVATYMSLSTAVPLTMASTAIFTNQPFRDHEKVQARARVDRLGQDGPVKFVDIFLDTGEEPNISTRSGDILDWSRQQVAAIMGSDYSGEIEVTMESYLSAYGCEENRIAETTELRKIVDEIADEIEFNGEEDEHFESLRDRDSD